MTSCMQEVSRGSSGLQYVNRRFHNQRLHVFAILEHVGRDQMSLEVIQRLPLFNDRDDVGAFVGLRAN